MTQYSNQPAPQAFDWNSPLPDIQQTQSVLVPDGRYAFQVKSKNFTSWTSGKLAGFPKCEITLTVWNETGAETEVKANLTLADSMIWMVRQFWRACGEHVRPNEPFCPPWSTILGRQGWLDLGHRSYKDKDNNEKTVNEIKKYLEPDGRPIPPLASQYQQQYQQPQYTQQQAANAFGPAPTYPQQQYPQQTNSQYVPAHPVDDGDVPRQQPQYQQPPQAGSDNLLPF